MKKKSKANPGDGWTQQEAGWYTHPKLGGICCHLSGWHYYPINDDLDHPESFGPYKSLLAAQRAAAGKSKSIR